MPLRGAKAFLVCRLSRQEITSQNIREVESVCGYPCASARPKKSIRTSLGASGPRLLGVVVTMGFAGGSRSPSWLQRLHLFRPHTHTKSEVIVSAGSRHCNKKSSERTSLVDECSIRIFFAVRILTSIPLSKCRISMKLGSKARIYGLKIANACGFPSHTIFQSGLARQPLRLTKKEKSV
jgi:hypothetical protein